MTNEQNSKRLKIAAAMFGLFLFAAIAPMGIHAAFAWEDRDCPPGLDGKENPAHDCDDEDDDDSVSVSPAALAK